MAKSRNSRMAAAAAIAVVLALIPVAAVGQSVPTTMSYQGRLLDNSPAQDPVAGPVDIDFSIWSDPTSTNVVDRLWAESWSGVTISNGIFSVLLGNNGSPLVPSAFDGHSNLYLELTIDTETMSPRQQLGSVLFAMADEPANELQDPSLAGDTLGLSGSSATVDLSGYDNPPPLATDSAGAGAGHQTMQPFLGIRFIISHSGAFPSSSVWVDPPYLGEIKAWAPTFTVPFGWSLCEGQLLPIVGNESLFSLLGTTYGGNGRTDFGLPDLRGRVLLGEGTGPGLSPHAMGERGGAETHPLTAAELAAHTHPITAP